MSDVFISYASEDEEFVDRLRGALGRRGREVWVYTAGILPADEWRLAAHEAIDQSDALMFVMSRASLMSDPCLGELEHGVSLDKRVIPVCVDEAVKDEQMPETLAIRAWIMMRAGDDFERGLDLLIGALDTDLELARTHTRILVRARAWELGERRASPLLRGEELRAAEQWLERAVTNGGPQPTELHRAFIAASRRAASARRWRTTTISSAVLVLAAGLSVLALVLQGRANARQLVAQSRQLAKEAGDAFQNGRLDLGILLSLEAKRRAATVEAQGSLVRGVETVPAGMLAYRVLPQPGRKVAYSPDGRTVAFASGELWDTRSGRMSRLPVSASSLNTIVFSPDGSKIAAGTSGGTVAIWDVRARRLLRTLPAHADYVTDVAFSPAGTTLVAATNRGTVLRWDPRTGNPIGRGPLIASTQVNSVAFGLGGAVLAAGTDTGNLVVFASVSGRQIGEISLRESVYQVAFSHDGRTLAAALGSGKVLVEDVESRAQRYLNVAPVPQNSRSNPQVSIAFSPAGRVLTTSSDNGHLILWDYTTGRQLRTVPDDTGIASIAFSPDGHTIATADGNSTGILWDTNTELAIGQSLAFGGAGITAMAFSADGRRLAIGRGDGAVQLSDANGGHIAWHAESGSPGGQAGVNTLAFRPDGQVLASAGDDQMVRLWGARTGQPLRAVPAAGPVSGVAFSPDGSLLAAGLNEDRGTLLILNGATGATVRTLHAGASIYSVAWLGANRLAGATASGVVVWNAQTGGRLHMLPGDADTMSIAATQDGVTLALLNSTGTVTLWDTATWTTLRTLGTDGAGTEVVFSRDGQTVAAANSSGLVRMWDVNSGQQLGGTFRVPWRISAQPTGVERLAFNPAQTTLAMGTSDGAVVRLNALPFGSIGATGAYLCSIVRRSLSLSEWRQLVPGEPYHATCAGSRYR